MSKNNNLFKSVVLARTCSFKELKDLLKKANSFALGARTNKHFGVGKTTARRNTKKESIYGCYKSLISIITQAKLIKSSWSMEDVDLFLIEDDLTKIFEYKKQIIKELI